MIDLRSDTVTRPTPAMRRAMVDAEVGDDVYGEDPTVQRLEARMAELTGMAAGLFVPTGSMGNQLAVKLHTRPGTEVIVEARSHLYNYELAAMASISGVLPRVVPTPAGLLDADAVAVALHVGAPYYVAPTSLIALENTHNMAGGRLLPMPAQQAIVALARTHGIPVHLDGARIFNAAAATGQSVAALCTGVDTVMVCLSKGLGAPIGSLLCGSAELIREARVWRKRLGGGMRQVGVLAAAGLVALDESPPRLLEDHAHAQTLAAALAELPGVTVAPVETNIVIAGLAGACLDAPQLIAELQARGILALAINPRTVRFVTHYDVGAADIRQTVAALRELLGSRPC